MNIGYYLVFEMSHTLQYKINAGLKKENWGTTSKLKFN